MSKPVSIQHVFDEVVAQIEALTRPSTKIEDEAAVTKLQELAADEGILPRRLDPATAGSQEPKGRVVEAAFRYELNADAMATEKLAEGIRNFVADQMKLEALISAP